MILVNLYSLNDQIIHCVSIQENQSILYIFDYKNIIVFLERNKNVDMNWGKKR